MEIRKGGGKVEEGGKKKERERKKREGRNCQAGYKV